MPNPYFRFKKFTVFHDRCAMKVGTDGVLLGAWTDISGTQQILDIGTGTGLIALMLAQRSQAQIDAVEIDKDACIQARENLDRSPWSERIQLYHSSVQDYATTCRKRYDLIVSNPPFFENAYKASKKARTLARHNDLLAQFEILQVAEKLLRESGRLAVIYPTEEAKIFQEKAEAFSFFCNRKLYAIEGRISSKVIEKFQPIVKKSIQSSLVDLMTQSLNREMSQPSEANLPTESVDDGTQDEPEEDSDGSKTVTTAEELEAFEKVKSIAAKSKTHKLEVKHKDVVSYFGLNVGKTTWWFLRFYLSPNKKSFVTRLPINEVKALAPGFEVQEMSASLGDAASRVLISSVNDLDKLSNLILKCYEIEASRHSSVKVA